MRNYRVILFSFLVAAALVVRVAPVFASGEITLVRAPEEFPQGDDITIVISATAHEKDIDRILALEYPENWKPKRAWRVEAGASAHVGLIPDPEIQSLISAEPGHRVLALADYLGPTDLDAEGIAYFIVFHTTGGTGAEVNTAVLKAALVERTSPDAPPIVDPRTHRSKPQNTSWHMSFPAKPEFTFAGMTFKHLVATIKMQRLLRSARSMLAYGAREGTATLHTTPEALADYFQHPFTIQFWLRTTEPEQTFLALHGSDGSEAAVGTALLGQPAIELRKPQARSVLAVRGLINDGSWHHIVFSRDSLGKMRLFLDGQPAATAESPKSFMANVTAITIGDTSKENDFSIDELRMLRGAMRDPSEFEHTIAASARDTIRNAFALFHFDDYGNVARSSVPSAVPVYITLDSDATITETTSPVQFDPVMLSADLISTTQVGIRWHTTCEIGVKQYRLERRVGTFGPFEKVLTIDAKHGMRAPKRGQSIVSREDYSINEELPKLNGDIELYYRLASVGFSDKEPPSYSVPVKIEYGAERDVFVEQNEPNPFNPTTQIAFRLPKATVVKLSIFDMIGREVATLVNTKLDAGRHVYTLDATNWPGGIYFYKVKTAKTTITRKMVLAK